MTPELNDQMRETLHAINRSLEFACSRYTDSSPWEALDTTGRPLLADLLVAKASLLTALANDRDDIADGHNHPRATRCGPDCPRHWARTPLTLTPMHHAEPNGTVTCGYVGPLISTAGWEGVTCRVCLDAREA